jgi:hypothetical protein
VQSHSVAQSNPFLNRPFPPSSELTSSTLVFVHSSQIIAAPPVPDIVSFFTPALYTCSLPPRYKRRKWSGLFALIALMLRSRFCWERFICLSSYFFCFVEVLKSPIVFSFSVDTKAYHPAIMNFVPMNSAMFVCHLHSPATAAA